MEAITLENEIMVRTARLRALSFGKRMSFKMERDALWEALAPMEWQGGQCPHRYASQDLKGAAWPQGLTEPTFVWVLSNVPLIRTIEQLAMVALVRHAGWVRTQRWGKDFPDPTELKIAWTRDKREYATNADTVHTLPSSWLRDESTFPDIAAPLIDARSLPVLLLGPNGPYEPLVEIQRLGVTVHTLHSALQRRSHDARIVLTLPV